MVSEKIIRIFRLKFEFKCRGFTFQCFSNWYLWNRNIRNLKWNCQTGGPWASRTKVCLKISPSWNQTLIDLPALWIANLSKIITVDCCLIFWVIKYSNWDSTFQTIKQKKLYLYWIENIKMNQKCWNWYLFLSWLPLHLFWDLVKGVLDQWISWWANIHSCPM